MNDYQVVCDLIRQQFASVVWTHKVQEKQADIYSERYSWLETINIIVAALTTCGIVGLIFQDENSLWLKIITAIFSFATLAISAYYKSFDPSTKGRIFSEPAKLLNFLITGGSKDTVFGKLHKKGHYFGMVSFFRTHF